MIADSVRINCVPQPPTKQKMLDEMTVQVHRGVATCLIRAMSAFRQTCAHWTSI